MAHMSTLRSTGSLSLQPAFGNSALAQVGQNQLPFGIECRPAREPMGPAQSRLHQQARTANETRTWEDVSEQSACNALRLDAAARPASQSVCDVLKMKGSLADSLAEDQSKRRAVRPLTGRAVPAASEVAGRPLAQTTHVTEIAP